MENSIKGSVAGIGEDMHDALTLLVTHGRFKTDAFVNAVYQIDDIQAAFESLAARPGDLKTQIVM
jgi:threonine dehydrogenase-like Zn-dependent dehydrogenase